MPDYAFADTSVLSHLTRSSEHSLAYNGWIGNRLLAINDQVQAELLGTNYTGGRKQRLDDLASACVKLEMNESTHVCYAKAAAMRAELKKTQHEGRDAGDADMWIISSALEYEIPLFSHDRQQVQLARMLGVQVVTNITDLKEGNPKDWT